MAIKTGGRWSKVGFVIYKSIWEVWVILWSYEYTHIWQSYIIVQALSSSGFKLRPSLTLRQGLTPPLPLWRGLWPSRIGTAWASALPSLPAADIRVTNWAERRSAGDTGEGDSEGEGNTWPGANLLCTLSLTQSLLQAPLPHPHLLILLLYSNSLTQFFTLSSARSCLQTRFSAILCFNTAV